MSYSLATTMIDPRDEIVNKDDLLSDDSSDELKDLYKEFELKYQAIRKKELAKKSKQFDGPKEKAAHEPSAPVVPRSPNRICKPPEATKEVKYEVEVPLPKTKKASEFLSKLYDANLTKTQESCDGIDYSLRKFEFDFTNYEIKPKEVDDEVCPISGHCLRRRYYTREEVNQLIRNTDENMKILKVDKMLAKTNKTNNYREPMYTNWCLVGFVLHKSDVLYTKNDKKYMKLRVGNFQNSVELLLFDGAFGKNYKLQQGDLILVLNPIVNKYEIKVNEHISKTGFNLKLDGSNINSILEIGAIRDFGICKFIKKIDNQRCTNVVNITKQHLCDIHLDNKFRQSTRMELNGVSLRSPTKSKTKVFLNMNKSRNQSNFSGFIREYNEDSTFSTSGSGKIDSRKFQDPKLLQTQLKRRKLQNERANDLLEKKLSKLSSRNPIVESLNMKGTHSDKSQEMGHSSHFSPSMISKIGFDPTNQDNDASKQSHPERLQELYQLSAKCSSKKSLGSSIDDKRSKLQKWQKNINALKSYDSKLMQSDLNLSKSVVDGIKTAGMPQNRVAKTNRVVLSDDDFDFNDKSSNNDDDDLDIDFGNDDMKAKYEKVVGR